MNQEFKEPTSTPARVAVSTLRRPVPRRHASQKSVSRQALASLLSILLVFGSIIGALPAQLAFADEGDIGIQIGVDEAATSQTGANETPSPSGTDVSAGATVGATAGATVGATAGATVGATPTDSTNGTTATDEATALDALAAAAAQGSGLTTLANNRNVVVNSLDYLAGTVDGLGENNVFDVVTYERLQKSVLQKNGKSIIVLGSPRNESTQLTLKYINTIAKEQGIEKIYFFDPHLAGEYGYDGVDITNPDASAAIYALWTALRVAGGAGATATAQLKYINDYYDGDDTYLFVYDRSNGADSADTIVAAHLVQAEDVEEIIECGTEDLQLQIENVLDTLGTDTETRASQYDFFTTAFSAASPRVNTFYGDDYYQENPEKFKLAAVSSAQLLYLLSTQGAHNVLVSGSWCPDSRQAIGYVSENATRYNSSPVYVWDFRANGSSSAVTYLSSDTSSALPSAGWVGAEIVKALGDSYAPAYDNGVRSVRAGGDPSNPIEAYGKTFRSPYLFKLSVNATGERTLVQDWVHTLQAYELPWHYSLGADYKFDPNADYYGAQTGDRVDYEFSSGHLTNAQKAFGRADLGTFFAGSQIRYAPSSNISTSVSKEDNGCGDDNDPLNDLNADKLIPNHGTTDYDVQHYDINLAYDPLAANQQASITATTVVTAIASANLNIISLDFRALAVDNSGVTVTVNDSPVNVLSTSRVNIDDEDNNKIDIRVGTTISAGSTFKVTIPYTTGILDEFVAEGASSQGFFTRLDNKGIAALGEPLGATYWFPNNDTPYDGATYTVTLKAPTAYTNVSNGVRTSNSTSSGIRTTVWNVSQDTASYQIFAYISNDVTEFSGTSSASYPLTSQAVQQVTVSDGEGGVKVIPGLSYANKTIYDTNANRNRDKVDLYFNKLPYYIQELEKIAGAYPGESAGFVFESLGDGHGEPASWGAIETRDRPFFTSTGITSETTFVHEYTHQWYGNAVRIAAWEDLWLNEGFATYVTDLFYENTQDFDAQAKWRGIYNRTAANNAWWTYAPANIENESDLFGGASAAYNRGALALAALRSTVGDDVFFEILNTWVPTHKGQAVTTGDFVTFASDVSDINLTTWADAWLYGQTKPTAWPVLVDPNDDAPTYEIIENFTAWTGTGSLTARVDAPLSEFVQIRLNGTVLVLDTDYTLNEGSTVITLLEDFLKTLEPGEYTLVVEFDNGRIFNLPFTVSALPETAYLTFAGPETISAGLEVTYTVSLGNITGPGAFAVTVSASDELELARVEAISDEWFAFVAFTNPLDGSQTIVFAPRSSDPDATITAETAVLNLIYTAEEVGTASVTLTDVKVSLITLDDEGQPVATFVPIEFLEGTSATATTEITEAIDPYDFNRDGFVDLNDLTYAKYYYRASAETGGALWNSVVERGIDVNSDNVIDLADFILIITRVYGV